MPDNNTAHPTSSGTADDDVRNNSSSESNRAIAESVLKDVLQMEDELLEQTLIERRQRSRIGERLANTIIPLTFGLLVLFWGFVIALFWCTSSDNFEQFSTLLAIMFSTTHISVVVLYFALIKGVFQKIGGDKAEDTPSTILERIESIVDNITQNTDKS